MGSRQARTRSEIRRHAVRDYSGNYSNNNDKSPHSKKGRGIISQLASKAFSRQISVSVSFLAPCKYVRLFTRLRTSRVSQMCCKMQRKWGIAEGWEEEPISREASCPIVSNIQRRFLLFPISPNVQRSTSLRLEWTQVVHFSREGDARSLVNAHT